MDKALATAIKEDARRIGFDLVGIVRPQPSSWIEAYQSWLSEGFHGSMHYLARPDAVKKRADPRAVLSAVRSIVVVGLNYYPGPFTSTPIGHGRIARYAWGIDYHDVMMDMLGGLADRIEWRVRRPTAHRAYVDFGPVLERELAQQAGLGWVGKNANLINPRLGSYVFLGELLVDVELAADGPFKTDRCGSCTACLEACPTGALVSPRLLDARRCISYLTIENRDEIPTGLRHRLDDWVFGCDVCQEVCPWNDRFAREAARPLLRATRSTLDLIDLINLDESAFRTRFRETPLWRPRRAGLLRNAAVVLGNTKATNAIPALERAHGDCDPLVAEHAKWAVQEITRN